ncbi:MAG: zinc ABC transporter substrate-binding protein [Chloroflexota bacterium]|nr:zinc ABC transporter substrate-binding protein [Chloroflexota bacterium]
MTASDILTNRISNRARILAVGTAIAATWHGALRIPALADDGKRRVVATTGQVGDLARIIGGEFTDVKALMGPGVDPHLFKASEGDVIDLIESDIIMYSGLHLEGGLGEVLEQAAKRIPVSEVSDGVPEDQLIQPEDDAFDGNPDPHFWFDPTLWAHAADETARALGGLDSDNVDAYLANAEACKAELMELDAYAMEQFSRIPAQSRILVTAHDAFGYLGRRYGLDVVGLQGISTATEAGVRDVQSIADLLVANKVKAIFVETSVPERTIEAVQVASRDRGWEVAIGGSLYSDAMGDEGTEEGTYLGMMRYDVDTIVAGLSGEETE